MANPPVLPALCQGPNAFNKPKCAFCLPLGCKNLPTRKVDTCPGPNPPANRADLLAARCAACAGRINLLARRQSISNMLGATVPTTGLQLEAAWTQRVVTIVENLYDDYFQGNEPCAYTFCLTGSGARKEACPYSDIDCFIVVETGASAGDITALATASKHVRERLVDMNWHGAGPEQDKGFVFCIGGLNPEGWNSVGTPPQRLIDKPHELAGVLEANLDTTSQAMAHVVSGLQEADFGFGDQQLFTDFQREIDLIVGKTCLKMASRPLLTLKKRQGMETVRDAVTNPEFDIPDPNGNRFNIKKGFYRLPQFLSKGLAWYYGIASVRTLDQISALQTGNRLSDSNARHFINAINKAGKVRVKSHLHAQKESDWVRSAANADPNPDNEYVLTANELADLKDAIKSLTKLKDLGTDFIGQKEKFIGKRRNPFAA